MGHQAVHGTIRRRLLVNALVDPDEAATRLPGNIRPHVAAGGTVVGCCLLDITAIRPAGVPAALGRRLRAAAHRISVEWEDASGATTIGVYVPARHTDSSLATLLGGRWFPGVHEPATVDITEAPGRLVWSSEPIGGDPNLAVRVAAVIPDSGQPGPPDAVGRTCLGAAVGLSPDRRGGLEAATMEPTRRHAVAVAVEDLSSPFVESFASAKPTTSYLMHDVDVVWTRTARLLPVRAAALPPVARDHGAPR
jgi:hypothetical protein